MKLTQEMYDISQRLSKSTSEIYKLAHNQAETERIYRMELSKEIFRLREDKLPATLIPDLARGNISDLKFDRDLAEAKYKAAIEALKALNSQLSGLQTVCKYQSDIGA